MDLINIYLESNVIFDKFKIKNMKFIFSVIMLYV